MKLRTFGTPDDLTFWSDKPIEPGHPEYEKVLEVENYIKARLISTPKGNNYFYKKYIEGNADESKKWIDKKGRIVEVQSMSDKWLNNIRRKFEHTGFIQPILDEIKRRKNLRKK